jgi:hypothetical protein
MASEKSERVRMWSFRQAPREFQTLFREGKDTDWVAHAPESERQAIEPSLLQWRPVYPVQSTELADRSVVYHGAPSDALDLIAEHGSPVTGSLSPSQERRKGIRVAMTCPSRYNTHTEIGFGHTIDISVSGIAFTTESLLARNTDVTLRVKWPIRLESGVPVALYAVGKLARAEPMKAAMQIDSMSFAIEN